MFAFKVMFTIFLLFGSVTAPAAMTFTFRAPSTVEASGPIEKGDADRFAALPQFNTLALDSPGGLVGEALAIAAMMDTRGSVATLVRAGSSCASACAMALFVSGETRIVDMGGRLGIHSCRNSDGTPAPECNARMASNALGHGVPWGVIEGFANYTKPSDMMWITAEDAECWGLMKWGPEDTSNNGIACFKFSLLKNGGRKPPEVTAENADDVSCRMSAGTSDIFVSSGKGNQGFTQDYWKGCERVAASPSTPKYAAIDIILWLALTDPKVSMIKPGTLVAHILNRDEKKVDNCWKCLAIFGMSQAILGYPNDALGPLQAAVSVVRRQTGSVPPWLASRVDVIQAQATKHAQ